MPLALLQVPVTRHLSEHASVMPAVHTGGHPLWAPVAMAMAAYHSSSRIVAHGPMMAISGTDLGDFDHAVTDLVSDAQLVIGQVRESARYKAAREYLSHHAEVQYIVGHSLGGTIADALARDTGRMSIAYNPGAGPPALWGPDLVDEPNHRVVRIVNDPVSAFDALHARTLAAALDPHGLTHQFDGGDEALSARTAWVPGAHMVITVRDDYLLTPSFIVRGAYSNVWNYRESDGTISAAPYDHAALLSANPTWCAQGWANAAAPSYPTGTYYKPRTYYTPATSSPVENDESWSGLVVSDDTTTAMCYKVSNFEVIWAAWGPPEAPHLEMTGTPDNARAVDVTSHVVQSIKHNKFEPAGGNSASGDRNVTMCLRGTIEKLPSNTIEDAWANVVLGADCWSHGVQNTDYFPRGNTTAATWSTPVTLYEAGPYPHTYVNHRWKVRCEATFGAGVVLVAPPFTSPGVIGINAANLTGRTRSFSIGQCTLLHAAMVATRPFASQVVTSGNHTSYSQTVDFTERARTPLHRQGGQGWHWDSERAVMDGTPNAYVFTQADASNFGPYTTAVQLFAELR